MERVSWVRWAFDARDCAEIFADGPEFMVRHVLENRPWHDLENLTVKRRRQAICRDSSRARRMEVIEIFTGPYDLKKI